MPEEYSLSPLMSPRDTCSPTTGGTEAAVDLEIYSGDWASLSQGATKRAVAALAARSLQLASCSFEGCTWTGACGDLEEHAKRCAFAASRHPSSRTSLRAATPRDQVAERGDVLDESACRWPRTSCDSCLHCSSSAPWAFGEQAEEVQFQRGELRNIQDRLDHVESTLEKWKLSKEELDARIANIEKDTNTKVEQLSRACLQLDKRLKKLQAERKTLVLGGQEGLDTALREVKDSVKDMNVTLIQGMQDKARAAEVYKKFDDVDDLLRDLHDQVKVCHHAQVRLCREEDHIALRAQVSRLEAELWKLHSGGAEVVPAPGIGRGTVALPGNCICWNVAEAMQVVASTSRDLSFSSFNRVSSTVFHALDFRGLRLAFVRKKQGASIWDVPKSWCYLHAPKGTYLEFVMTVGDEERRFVHEFETSRSFGGVFNLPFTPNFDASDLHEGIFVQTLCEGRDGRQSAYPRLACVLEVNDAETINGRCRKVAWVAFPDGSEQAVELYWITLVQKLPPMSVVITNARKSQHFGNDVSVTSFSVRQS